MALDNCRTFQLLQKLLRFLEVLVLDTSGFVHAWELADRSNLVYRLRPCRDVFFQELDRFSSAIGIAQEHLCQIESGIRVSAGDCTTKPQDSGVYPAFHSHCDP
jgi:hypothetical protein